MSVVSVVDLTPNCALDSTEDVNSFALAAGFSSAFALSLRP
jgi:hypothetical protein